MEVRVSPTQAVRPFPSISTGVYGYPSDLAAQISVEALRSAVTNVETVLLVAFTPDMAELWEACLSDS